MLDLASLVLVGCGKMGGALLSGWLDQGLRAENVTVVEPFQDFLGPYRERGVKLAVDFEGLAPDLQPDLVLFAVKPQMMDQALPPYRRFVRPGCAFLSIAAGKTIAYFEAALGPEAAVVRAMPNTPAAVGRGMTVLAANAQAGETQKELCGKLLAGVGEIDWVGDEALLDAVTALSGGGPAYVFLLIECLAEAGAAAGLPADLAMRLARGTVAGAGELVYRSDEPASKLRENVTSPGGTTLEALKVLMAEDGILPIFTRAIAAATHRSRELAG